jgi:hypothetical protein
MEVDWIGWRISLSSWSITVPETKLTKILAQERLTVTGRPIVVANIGLALSSTTLDTTVQGPESAAWHCGWYGPHCLPTLACQTHHELGAGTRISPTCTMLCVVTSDWFVLQILTWTQFKTSTNCICDLGECGWAVVRVVQFASLDLSSVSMCNYVMVGWEGGDYSGKDLWILYVVFQWYQQWQLQILLNNFFAERFFQSLFCGCFAGTFASHSVSDFLS